MLAATSGNCQAWVDCHQDIRMHVTDVCAASSFRCNTHRDANDAHVLPAKICQGSTSHHHGKLIRCRSPCNSSPCDLTGLPHHAFSSENLDERGSMAGQPNATWCADLTRRSRPLPQLECSILLLHLGARPCWPAHRCPRKAGRIGAGMGSCRG